MAMRSLRCTGRALLLPVAAILAWGCTVGPNYKRPAVTVPQAYRGQPADGTGGDSSSLGDQRWREVFEDETLQTLIGTALQQNYDLRIAATRILEAQAQLGITRADQRPTV